MQDTYRHKGMRQRLIHRLRKQGIHDERVLAAMEIVPRHFFLDKAFEEHAYEDKPFPIGNKQTISQPFTVAYQTQLLAVKKREKILEIGTGSGYQAAILGALGARIYTIERHESLYKSAKKLLQQMKFSNVRCYHKDGYKGLPEFAPFDKIVVTAAAPEVPGKLLAQLAIGGYLVIPVGKKVQDMLRIERLSETEFKHEKLEQFRFVPFLKGTTKE